ncbi:MAG TPA: hypothetical protein VJT71_15635, partial [Pyrinomonadaceae bacterium]|nr:hypothetical protein [Pyrinomonadaceae bacterium]
VRDFSATLIFYEAPHRLAASLKDALAVLGNRPAAVARELTKLHEELARGSLAELAEKFSARDQVKGEIVLIIGAETIQSPVTEPGAITAEQLPARVRELEGEGLSAKHALKKAARELGLKRAEAYRMMVTQKKRRSK